MKKPPFYYPRPPSDWTEYALGHIARIGTGSADTQDAERGGSYPFYVRSPHVAHINVYTHDTEAILTAGDGDVGEIFHLARGKFAAHQRVYVIEPSEKIDIGFLYYVMQALFKLSLLGNTAKSTVESLRRHMLTSFHFPAPSKSLQKRIADFLDHETAEIDEMLKDEQQVIDLLHGRWSSEVVTRIHEGMGKPPLASSSSPTWPTVPQHWRRTRLKSTIKSARNGAWGDEPGDGEASVRCIRVADFDKMRGSIHERNVTDRSYPKQVIRNLSLRPGDLLLEKSGGGPTIPVGNVVLYEGPGGDMYSNFVARLELNPEIDPLYALYLHRSLYSSGVTERSVKQTTGIQNLDAEAYFNEPIFLPPPGEQRQIGTYLRSRRAELDAITTDLTRAITLAKERRAALITAAVTGQIDVTAKQRPAAEQLEDDIKELS